jgi:hypothetical protein
MVTVHYRRWCPPQSPLRIEFPPELLRDVRLQGAEPVLPRRWRPRFNRAVNQSSGLLFGVQHEDEVRVLSARADSGDATSENSTPVGTYVCRARGEVFLTDDDLANFEKHQGILALVVVGARAGFFVRVDRQEISDETNASLRCGRRVDRISRRAGAAGSEFADDW